MSENLGTPETIDIERLLVPISDENPAGPDLRDIGEGEAYFELRGLRDASRDIEQNYFMNLGVVHDANAPAVEYNLNDRRWDDVLRLSVKAISEMSKSYEVAAWLCESLIRIHGFGGFRDGMHLARELAERYWDCLHPLPDDEGFRRRVIIFRHLFESSFVDAIKEIPLTEGEGYSYLEYEFSKELGGTVDAEERSRKLGGRRDVSIDGFTQAMRESSIDFLRDLRSDVTACTEECQQLSAVWSERCGKDDIGQDVAPSTREVSRALGLCLSMINSIAGDRLEPADAPMQMTEEGPSVEVMVPSDVSPPDSNGRSLTRDSALGMLNQLADFFEKVEPHSPISYHIRQAAKWGRMPLPDLLNELIPDDMTRQELFKRVGIEDPGQAEN